LIIRSHGQLGFRDNQICGRAAAGMRCITTKGGSEGIGMRADCGEAKRNAGCRDAAAVSHRVVLAVVLVEIEADVRAYNGNTVSIQQSGRDYCCTAVGSSSGWDCNHARAG